jgi:ribosome-binding factor A
MKQTKRTRQVADVIRNEMADLFRREIRDPDFGFVTITDVEVSTDLKVARIFVSVFGDDDQKAKSLVVLEKVRGHLRRLLAPRLHLRYVPDIEFRLDTSVERASRIEQILHDVLPKDAPATDDEGDNGDE